MVASLLACFASTYPVEGLILHKWTRAELWRSITKIFVAGVGVKVLRSVEGMDMSRCTLLVDDGITPGMSTFVGVEKAHLDHLIVLSTGGGCMEEECEDGGCRELHDFNFSFLVNLRSLLG